jgi:two-component system NtrC family sensor kinase
MVQIVISDTGHGMPAAVSQRVFEPFFTTKPPGEGTGLGLSVSYGIIQAHEGTISVESTPEVGTTFTILLPLYSEGKK